MSQFSNFKPIITKLKKKKSLLRKTPNLNEVSDELINLSKDLSNFPRYSAYCVQTASRIEHSNNTSIASSETEFDHLLVAARKFDADNDMNSAISCYRHAIKLCHQSLSCSVLTELASMYQRYDRYDEAAIEYIACGDHRNAGLCYLTSGDYLRALNCFEQIEGVKKYVSSKMTSDVGKASSKVPCLTNVSAAVEELTLKERFELKDDLVNIFLLKLCVFINNLYKLVVNFPIVPIINKSSYNSSNVGASSSVSSDVSFKSEVAENLNICLESLLKLLKEGKYRRDIHLKLMIYKELNPQLDAIQRKLLHYLLEKERI